jgi:hypothetical protein
VVSSNEEETMAHTHEYDCVVCGAHFDSSKDVARHHEEAHMKDATGMERPRTDRSKGITPAMDMRDRNPRQGALDPSNDRSKAT